MKNTQSLSLILTAILTLSACSSAPKTQVSSLDNVNLDEYLTDRALAQVQAGGELLAKMVGSAVSQSEKQSVMRAIEKAAQEQGISTVKGMSLSAKNLTTAFTKQEAAQIVKAMSASNPNLFNRPAFKKIESQANADLAQAVAAQKASGDVTVSGVNLVDKNFLADVKNVDRGFGGDRRYTKVYVVVKKNANLAVWDKNTCTTFGKLDKVAAGNLLIIGENQAEVSKTVASITSGKKATECMIKKGSAQALNDIVNVLHVPANQAANTLQLMTQPCNLLPESYAKAGQELIQANNGQIPAVSQVQCN